MKITTGHPGSSCAQPVILDDSGHVMDYATGIRAIRDQFGDTQQQFAARLGVSIKTVQSWEQWLRIPSNTALRLLGTMLTKTTVKEMPNLSAKAVLLSPLCSRNFDSDKIKQKIFAKTS